MKNIQTRSTFKNLTANEKRLMAQRFCDLKLKIKGSDLEWAIEKLNAELEDKGLVFKPYFWISSEWFVPDGHTGIAIPFYLLDQRLKKIEKKIVGFVEGHSRRELMKLLRHECGHAIDNAYRLRRRRDRQEVFGRSSEKYAAYYEPKIFSKSFVKNLAGGYAQSHPDEDFAETFAVWLDPDSNWKNKYAGWPAIKKLEYVDALFSDLIGVKPVLKTRNFVDPIRQLKTTLATHYRRRRKYLRLDWPHKIFENQRDSSSEGIKRSSEFMFGPSNLKRKEIKLSLDQQKQVIQRVSSETGIQQYKVRPVVKKLLKVIDASENEQVYRLAVEATMRYRDLGFFKEPR